MVPYWSVMAAVFVGFVGGIGATWAVVHHLANAESVEKWERSEERLERFGVDLRRILVDKYWFARTRELMDLTYEIASDIEDVWHEDRPNFDYELEVHLAVHVIAENGQCGCGRNHGCPVQPAE